MIFKKLLAVNLIFLFFLTTGCMSQKQVVFHVQNGDYKIEVEIADTDAEIQKGFMFREKLELDKGMLFVFKEEALRAFWMKNTLIPLDMIFVSKDKKVTNIAENVQPCTEDPCGNYPSKEPAEYVIEINGGESAKNGIRPGDNVEF